MSPQWTKLPSGSQYQKSNSFTMTIKSLYFLVQEGEGFSVLSNDLLTYAAKEGYAVGGAVPAVGVYKYKNDELSFNRFKDTIVNLQRVSSDATQVIGAWVDADGIAYIELSDVVKSKQVAIELARARGEKAFYDFANSETIFV